jgi:MFS family permease
MNVSLSAEAAVAVESAARRNAIILAAANAVSGSFGSICVTLGGLAGAWLLAEDKSLATLPITAMNLGTAAGAMPAAELMRRIGRRLGFMGGAGVAFVASLVAAAAIVVGSFWLFTAGLFGIGFANAFTQQFRFAAADSGSPALRARAVSWVLTGGILSAVIGPQTVIFTRDLLSPVPFAGAFVAAAVLAVISAVILSALGGTARLARAGESHAVSGRPLHVIARQPRFLVALFCAISGFGLMSMVMTAAPLAMVGCGLTEDNAALGIQWHVIGMYGPSFITGGLIVRYGKETIIAIGLALLTACGLVALAGIDLLNFWSALVLLGIGWNFTFIGGTTMLTETYLPEEKSRVQGFNDMLVFGTASLGSFLAGSLFATIGWAWLVSIIFPMVAIAALLLGSNWLARLRNGPGTA